MARHLVVCLGLIVGMVGGPAAALGQCPMGWAEGFEAPGLDEPVHALAVFDDGSGPALYAGGEFSTAGPASAKYIAKWDGSTWSGVGVGVNHWVRALAVYDDGTGPALYAGGKFTTAGGVPAWRVAKWDGTAWSVLGAGVLGTVHALAVFDDGSGPALYAGGEFTQAGGLSARFIAKWDGSTWSPLGSGMSTWVQALTVFDDGSGPALYAAGEFVQAGGVSAYHVAKWDGFTWSALGSGMGPHYAYVRALTVFDDGSGPALYAGGEFATAGGVSAQNIARWNGLTWSALGPGLSPQWRPVYALTVFDDGSGPALYAGGAFTAAGGGSVNYIAKWDGAAWSALGAGTNQYVYALAVFDDGRGAALYAGGEFTTAGGIGAHRIGRWDGASWSSVGPGNGLAGSAWGLTVFDDGSGPGLYAGGRFHAAGTVAAERVARWDGSSWSALGSGIGGLGGMGYVEALTAFDDGSGPALYVGGRFSSAGEVAANCIARWDGVSWSALASGVSGQVAPYPAVFSLAVYDDGRGPALYAGGLFTTAGGASANHIAKWDGVSWSPLGSGVSAGGPSGTAVQGLTVFDDGNGPALYVGGWFTMAGAVSANGIARWDGSTWSPLGSGVSAGSGDPGVAALTVFDDGSGAALYAGGYFTTAGGISANHIAKWDGTGWSALAGGVGGPCVYALTVFDDGSGAALYAGGNFNTAGGISAIGIARWDGWTWSPLGSGAGGVTALAVFDDGSGPRLYGAGQFISAGGKPSAYIGKWGCVWLLGDLNCDGVVDRDDVDPFVLVLTSTAPNYPEYYAQFPDCRHTLADCNNDGTVNFDDIDPFVALLGG